MLLNKARKRVISDAVIRLREVRGVIETVRDDELNAMENVPENLQESERYSSMEDAVDIMDDAIDNLDDIISALDNIA